MLYAGQQYHPTATIIPSLSFVGVPWTMGLAALACAVLLGAAVQLLNAGEKNPFHCFEAGFPFGI